MANIRSIEEADLPAVVTLMCESFPRRDRAYFETGLQRLAQREIPEGTEPYGLLIDDDGVKGAVLAISSWHGSAEKRQLFVNISTWCVAPSHRGEMARELYRRAGERDDAVNTNLSAAAHTLKTLGRFNFRPWTTGQFIGVAFRSHRKAARILSPEQALLRGLPQSEFKKLQDHVSLGGLAICVATADRIMPIILVRRRVQKVVPAAQLIYCENVPWLLEHGGALLWWLRARGFIGLIIDANEPPPGMVGKFYPGKAAKYVRGQEPAIDVDHTYSELLYLGL
ncbi:hypothetical protein [Phenylobacterium sp.]|uniref:hypothetical protein n=1 Tax=Phenylobacterium sp. TaxID=1871053 RepID=UPI00301DA7CD